MICSKIRPSAFILICLYSIFLIGAGFSRYLETDSGNILIHDITAESYEGFPYGARLYRPLQASSLNLRPSVLFFTGNIGDRYTCDHIAMEFARRGFVALTIEDFGRGSTPSAPEYETENCIDAGYTFLSTRSFTDHARIGLATFYKGAEKSLAAKAIDSFAARAFISPDADIIPLIPEGSAIFSAEYEAGPESDRFDNIYEIKETDAGMIANRSVIGSLLEQFHNAMPIPNDSPFWFSADAQNAQLLLALRSLLLVLLIIVCAGLSNILTAGDNRKPLRLLIGLILPLLLFLASSEIMNFFIVSVRLGSPFHYLPELSQIWSCFNLPVFLVFLTAAIVSGFSFGKEKGFRFISDIIAAAGIVICLAGFLPSVFGTRSGWEMMKISDLRMGICLVTILFSFHSLLLRIPVNGKYSRFCCASLNGIMLYFYCCRLPAEILVQPVV